MIWYHKVQRAIWALRARGLTGPLIFTVDRVKLVGYSPKERRADNDND